VPPQVIVVYITGYPGSGKSTLAHALLKRLGKTSATSAQLFSDKKTWPITYWPLAVCWLLKHAHVLAKVTRLIHTSKDGLPVRGRSRSFVRAARIMLSQFSLLASIQRARGEIIISDEPPLHRLWTAMFPVTGDISIPLLRAVVDHLVSPLALPCKTIHLRLAPPCEICVSRFMQRRLATSRFDVNTNDALIASFLDDELYPTLQEVANFGSEVTVNDEKREEVLAAVANRVLVTRT
jgi:hypothetical protein